MPTMQPIDFINSYIQKKKECYQNNLDIIKVGISMNDSNSYNVYTDTIFFDIQGKNIEISWGDEFILSDYPQWQFLGDFDIPRTTCHTYSCCKETYNTVIIIGENIQTLSFDIISSHFINTIDVTRCPNLIKLDFDRANISHIDLSYCEKLKYLSCDRNKLTYLNLTPLKSLEYFSCGFSLDEEEFSNKLKELNLSKCPNLKYLGCEYNCLSKINIQDCTKLEHINCSYNFLATSAIYEMVKALPFNESKTTEKTFTLEAPFTMDNPFITTEEKALWQNCLDIAFQKSWKINILPHNKKRRNIIRQNFYR